MRTILAITRKEMEQYFASTVGYVVITLFMGLCGFFFYIYLQLYVRNAAMAGQMGGETMELSQSILRPFFGNICFFFLLILPVITMKSFAEEKKLGTYELLMTSPITVPQLVLGKYLGAISVMFTILVLVGIFPVILAIFGHPDGGPILTGLSGLFLVGASFLTIGIFYSSVTENQVVAVVLTIITLLVLWVINFATTSEAWYGKVAQYISIFQRFDDFTKGVMNVNDAFYYVSFAFFFLFATGIVLQSQRWK